MTPSLNPYQSEQLRVFMTRHAADEVVAADFGEAAHPVTRLEWFPCAVPCMVAVKGDYDDTLALLYPAPRPVPRDPLFQHAGDILDSRPMLLMLHVQRAFLRDWQIKEKCMDAPDYGPAGSCVYTSASDEAYGADQTTWDREQP